MIKIGSKVIKKGSNDIYVVSDIYNDVCIIKDIDKTKQKCLMKELEEYIEILEESEEENEKVYIFDEIELEMILDLAGLSSLGDTIVKHGLYSNKSEESKNKLSFATEVLETYKLNILEKIKSNVKGE